MIHYYRAVCSIARKLILYTALIHRAVNYCVSYPGRTSQADPVFSLFINGCHVIEVTLQFINGYSSPVDAVTRLMPCGSNCYVVMPGCSTEALSLRLAN